ncbi:MAG: RNA polymerase-associated protein RapA [Legionella sp.]
MNAEKQKKTATLSVSPSGILHVVHHTNNQTPCAYIAQSHFVDAFANSPEEGLFALVTSKIEDDWSLALTYWREFVAMYVEQLSQQAYDISKALNIGLPSEEALQHWVLKVPPMPGGEYVTIDVLRSIWSSFDTWCCAKVSSHKDGVAGFLKKHLPAWLPLGRVCFHLAENKQDEDYPFAFMATYATQLAHSHEMQHKPLKHALQEYAGHHNKTALYHLLKPIHEAAIHCEWVREILESHDVYHPMAWTPAEAYQLLQSIVQLEEAGLMVKCPNWWKKRPKPKVQVNIGGKKSALLSADSLLNFNVTVALDGEPLTKEELQAIYQSETGLILLRGQYVEIDAEKLKEALSHWELVQKKVGDGLSFTEGMRLLAGMSVDLTSEEHTNTLHEWSMVQASDTLSTLLETIRHPETLKNKELDGELKATLRPYQEIGANWLDFLTELGLGACLADDMGLGKTLQVITLLLRQKKKQLNQPSLLILPASLLDNWRTEMQRFAPSLKPLFYHSAFDGVSKPTSETLSSLDVVVTTYGTLQRQPWLRETSWHLIILDEAQAIKNPMSIQTKLAKTLKGHARVALTGTPIENRLGDLWSLYDFICPGLLGTSHRFKQFIKTIESNKKSSYAQLRQLVQPYLLRRLKTDKSIIADLPDKTEVNVWCELTKEQLKLYTQAVHDMARTLENSKDGIQRRGLVLAYLMRFKQICNHPGQLLGDKDYHEQRSGKFDRLRYLCNEIAARQEKVLVFTQYREMTAPIAQFLEKCFGEPGLILHGGTPVAKRKHFVDKFQDEKGPPFFVLSLKAGGTGLNLTAANHVIHFDRWWNPAVENQATDRAFRIGQKRNVLVHKMICKGTIEEKIDRLITEKVSLATDVLQVNGESLLTEMDNQQLLDLVRLDLNQMIEEKMFV